MNEEELYKTKQEFINYFSSDSYMLNVAVDVIDNNIELLREYKQLQNNWNELKKFVEAKVKHWEEEEKKWIELGFMKFGGEANNKLIFKIVLNKMQELEDNNE